LRFDPLTFKGLPEVVRHVAHQSLEEQDEADPLVPSVPDLIAVLSHPDKVGIAGVHGWVEVVQGRDTGVSDLGANLASDLGRDGECAMDPAVGVHDALKIDCHVTTKVTYTLKSPNLLTLALHLGKS